MATPLENVIIRLNQLGFFAFLPFILTAAVMYGLLRRSKIFGEPEKNTAINASIALVSAFLVWAYPILSGMSVENYQKIYSEFFYRGTVASLILIFGIVIITIFSETLGIKLDLSKQGKLISGIIIVIFAFISIILSTVFFSSIGIDFSEEKSSDLISSVIFLVFFIAIIIGVVIFTSKEEKKS
ncbi:MAG: hypothetical protein QXY70_02635 [Nanopusillaceae archaeon]